MNTQERCHRHFPRFHSRCLATCVSCLLCLARLAASAVLFRFLLTAAPSFWEGYLLFHTTTCALLGSTEIFSAHVTFRSSLIGVYCACEAKMIRCSVFHVDEPPNSNHLTRVITINTLRNRALFTLCFVLCMRTQHVSLPRGTETSVLYEPNIQRTRQKTHTVSTSYDAIATLCLHSLRSTSAFMVHYTSKKSRNRAFRVHHVLPKRDFTGGRDASSQKLEVLFQAMSLDSRRTLCSAPCSV